MRPRSSSARSAASTSDVKIVGLPADTRPAAPAKRSTTTTPGATCTSTSRKACSTSTAIRPSRTCASATTGAAIRAASCASSKCSMRSSTKSRATASTRSCTWATCWRSSEEYVQTDFTDSELHLAGDVLSRASHLARSSATRCPTPTTSTCRATATRSFPTRQRARAAWSRRCCTAPPVTPVPSPDAMALAAIPPSTLRVDVENGSGVTGAARRVARFFATPASRSATSVTPIVPITRATEIHEHSSVTFAGARVREALPPALHEALVVPDADAERARRPRRRDADERRDGDRRHRHREELSAVRLAGHS